MEKITNITELNQAILILEAKKNLDEAVLKEQFGIIYESLKPINLIKNTIKKLAETPDFKNDLLNTSLSLAVGYLSKKITIGSTHNPIKQMLGIILQMGVTRIVSKNADNIKLTLESLIDNLFTKKDAEPYKGEF